MTRARGWLAAALTGAALVAAGCSDTTRTVDSGGPIGEGKQVPTEATVVPTTANQVADGGVVVDADAGVDAGTRELADAGVDAGTDAGTIEGPDAGPWPNVTVLDYSQAYNLGKPQSAAFDEGLNLWLLDGARIGFLRPGDSVPTWTTGIGQARNGFGVDTFATGSTVICGGKPGHAYVGYSAQDLQPTIPGKPHAYIPSPGDEYYTPERYAEYQKGDLDAVIANGDGTVALEEHLWRTIGASNANRQIGIHNTNDFHYDEDRSVLACERVTRGPYRGDVFISTNHGVTMIQGLTYNSHRHPGWYKYFLMPDGSYEPALQTMEIYGLGLAPNGDVLIANEQMIGALVPNGNLPDWDRENTWDGPVPWKFKLYNEALNDQESPDYWRAFQQVKSGTYYLGSRDYGLWSFVPNSHSSGTWTKLSGLPTDRITALKSTDDGALYIGTENAGLWRLEADGKTLARVAEISANRIKQLVYEPTVTPTMLMIVSDAGVTVLRGP